MRLPWYLKVKKSYVKDGKYVVEIKANSIGIILMIIKECLFHPRIVTKLILRS